MYVRINYTMHDQPWFQMKMDDVPAHVAAMLLEHYPLELTVGELTGAEGGGAWYFASGTPCTWAQNRAAVKR